MRDPQEHNGEQEKSEQICSVYSSYTGSPRQAEPVWRGEAGVQAAGWVVGFCLRMAEARLCAGIFYILIWMSVTRE